MNRVVALTAALLVGVQAAATGASSPAAPTPRTSGEEGAGALIEKIVAAPDDGKRSRLVERLIALGPAALEPARKARDAAQTPELGRAFARAARWILARQILRELRAGLETQLSFDGQYKKLGELGPEAVDALLAILEDEAVDLVLRGVACRALADLGSPEILPRLRAIRDDILVHPVLREQVGILQAVFGETYALDAELQRYQRLSRHKDERVRTRAQIELANLYYRIRNYKKAVDAYEEILAAAKEYRERIARRLKALGRQRDRESDDSRRLGIERLSLLLKEELSSAEEEETLHFYNAACSNCLAGNIEKAKEYLRRAVERDPQHYGNMEKDGDLERLRSHPSYPEFRRELGRIFEDESI